MGKITTFTPEEIAELEKRPSDVIREKLVAMGGEAAGELFDGFVQTFQGVHDGYLTQCHYAESALYKAVGADKYKDAMYPYFYNANKAFVEGYWDLPFKERAIIAINAPRVYHNCEMKLLGEDDKKLWFMMKVCGAGQMLWDNGLYAEGSGGALCSPHPITAGGDNFPVYCCHAPLAEIVCSDLNTAYIYQQDYPEQVGPCSCVFNVYKNIDDIPDSYFERIGRERPVKK